MLIPTKEDIELLKKGLPQITIIVLAFVLYQVFMMYRTSEQEKLKMVIEQRDLFKDLYIKQNNVIQNLKKYESSTLDTSNADDIHSNR